MTETNYWMLVSSAENFEISRRRGFDLAGMKRRHRRKAERVRPGDRVLFYCTGVQQFAGTATVTGTYFEDYTTIWYSKKDDVYPFRFPIRPDVILEPHQFVDALTVVPRMRYTKKWPPEHWHLAFQGNVHLLDQDDFALVEEELRRAAQEPTGAPANR